MEARAASEPSAPVRVVVVDDVEDVRELLRLQFALDGRFEVVGVGADGDEAIALARELQPDLLILDRHMPRRDGIEAIGPVREVAPGTAIVLYTAAPDPSVQRAALAAGAIDVLEKAAGPEFVERLTTRLLARAGGEEARSVEFRVGPVSSAAARTWIANTRRILAAVAAHPEVVEVPGEVLDLFQSLLDQWEAVAVASEEFVWVARANLDEVNQVIEHWAVIDAMTDDQLERLGVHWSPPGGQPFFEALTSGVLRALERREETRRLATRLAQQWAPYRQGATPEAPPPDATLST